MLLVVRSKSERSYPFVATLFPAGPTCIGSQPPSHGDFITKSFLASARMQSLTVRCRSVSFFKLCFLCGRKYQMKSSVILLSTSFVFALLTAGVADAASAKRASSSQTEQTGSMSYNQAMYECTSRYAGPRGYLGRDRGGYIEACFKSLTGKYPYDVGQNCPLRRC
jgi:hypothetical protein